jgi:hypothetical protein
MFRRTCAVLILGSLAALAAPSVFPAARTGVRGCAMCTKRCCCRRPQAGGPCRMENPCASPGQLEETPLPGVRAVLPGAVAAPYAADLPQALAAVSAGPASGRTAAPPTPPPRSIA